MIWFAILGCESDDFVLPDKRDPLASLSREHWTFTGPLVEDVGDDVDIHEFGTDLVREKALAVDATNAFTVNIGGASDDDAFQCDLTAQYNCLAYTPFLFGHATAKDDVRGIGLAPNGDIILAGTTGQRVNPLCTAIGADDGFFARLDPAGMGLLSCSQFTGVTADEGLQLAVVDNYAFVIEHRDGGGGETVLRVHELTTDTKVDEFNMDTDIGVPNLFDEPMHVFARLDPNDSDLVLVYVVGATAGDLNDSADQFPLGNVFGGTVGNWDAYVAQFTFDLNTPTILEPDWAFQFGTVNQDAAHGVFVNDLGGIGVVGRYAEDPLDLNCQPAGLMPNLQWNDMFTRYIELDLSLGSPPLPKLVAGQPEFREDVRGMCRKGDSAQGVVVTEEKVLVVGTVGGERDHLDPPQKSEDGIVAVFDLLPVAGQIMNLDTPRVHVIEGLGAQDSMDRAMAVDFTTDGITEFVHIVGHTWSNLDGNGPPTNAKDDDAFYVRADVLPL